MESGASGDIGPVSRDLPSIQLIVSPLHYHSDHDMATDVPEAGLEAVARSYAKIIDDANRLTRAEIKGQIPGCVGRAGRRPLYGPEALACSERQIA